MNKILVEMCGGLGDEICMIPSYRALKEKFLESEIHVKCRFRELLLLNPYVDHLIRHDITKINRRQYYKNYVIYWGTHKYYYSLYTKHLVDIAQDQLKIKLKSRKFNYEILNSDKMIFEELRISFPKDKIKICFDTFSSVFANRIEACIYKEVVDFLKSVYDCEIYQVGRGSDFLGVGHNVINKLNVRELAAMLSECDLFIGSNSGAFHLASMVGAQTLTFFTSTDPDKYIHNEKNHVIKADVECQGCLNKKYYASPVLNKKYKCPGEEWACKHSITADVIKKKLKEIL